MSGMIRPDDSYIDVIFPQEEGEQIVQPLATVEHAMPFKFYISNDLGGYYYGTLFRICISEHGVSTELRFGWDTPYGFLDASETLTDIVPHHCPRHILWMSDIPLEGTQNFNLRILMRRAIFLR